MKIIWKYIVFTQKQCWRYLNKFHFHYFHVNCKAFMSFVMRSFLKINYHCKKKKKQFIIEINLDNLERKK